MNYTKGESFHLGLLVVTCGYGGFDRFFGSIFVLQKPSIYQIKGNFTGISGSPLDLRQLLWLLQYIELKTNRHFLTVLSYLAYLQKVGSEFSRFFVSNFDLRGPTIYQNKGNVKGISGSPLDLRQLLWLLRYID